MNQQLIERFFQSKQGQEIQRQNADENIDKRKKLVKENEGYKQQMKALLFDKERANAKNRIALAEKELKEAKDHYVSVSSRVHVEQNRLEKVIKQNNTELLKTAPDYIFSCLSTVRGYFDTGRALARDKSQILHELLKEVDSWTLLALPFDDMKNKFNKMLSTIDMKGS